MQVQSIIALSKLINSLKVRGGLSTAVYLHKSLHELEELASRKTVKGKLSKREEKSFFDFQSQVKEHCETLSTILRHFDQMQVRSVSLLIGLLALLFCHCRSNTISPSSLRRPSLRWRLTSVTASQRVTNTLQI
jgi:hypothetical protein